MALLWRACASLKTREHDLARAQAASAGSSRSRSLLVVQQTTRDSVIVATCARSNVASSGYQMDRLRRAAELHGEAAPKNKNAGRRREEELKAMTQHPTWCAQYMASIRAFSR